MLAWVSTAVLGGLVAYFGYLMVVDFKAEQGTLWERLIAAGGNSATKLWARVVIVITALIDFAANSANDLGSPQFSQAIRDYLNPNYVGFAVIGIMLVTIWARNRTLKS